MISVVEILLGVTSLFACFDYHDVVERLTLRNDLARLAEQYPNLYGRFLASWSSKDLFQESGSRRGKIFFVSIFEDSFENINFVL